MLYYNSPLIDLYLCCVAQNNRKSAIWEEEDDEIWEGAPPRLEIAYDAKNGYLLTAQVRRFTLKMS